VVLGAGLQPKFPVLVVLPHVLPHPSPAVKPHVVCFFLHSIASDSHVPFSLGGSNQEIVQ